MNNDWIKELLQSLLAKEISIDEVLQQLKDLPFKELGFAKIDFHRGIRRIGPEVVFCEGKSAKQIIEIFRELHKKGQNILGTRCSPEIYRRIKRQFPEARYSKEARIVTILTHSIKKKGLVGIFCGGTSDVPIAEEVRITAEFFGSYTGCAYDVGVAGLHRLLAYRELLKKANVLVVIAGMEGALPSVIGGLVDKPVIGVPTSVGYGTGIKGLSALLGMLNSCVPGVLVVNIDNGFGAGYAAALINRSIEDGE